MIKVVVNRPDGSLGRLTGLRVRPIPSTEAATSPG